MRSSFAAHGALALLVIATSGLRFQNEPVYDDHGVLDGAIIHDFSNLVPAWTQRTMFISTADDGTVDSVDTYRPLTVTTFFVDAAWSGRDPFGYHLTNLILHLGCVLLLAFASRRLWGADTSWWIAAAVFAVQPWLVEAHVWINGRSDPLALLGCLACASTWSGARPRLSTTILGSVFLAAALFSKEVSLVLLPALLAVPHLGAWPSRRQLLARLIGASVSAGLYLGVRWSVLDGVRAGTSARLLDAAAVAPSVVLDAAWHSVVPSPPYLRSLAEELPHLSNSVAWVSFLALTLLVLILAHRGQCMRRVLFLGAWFVGPLVPVAVIATALWPGFGRYLYLPMPAVAWAIAWGYRVARHRAHHPIGVRIGIGGYIFVQSLFTLMFTRDFRSDDSLYGGSIAGNADAAAGHGFLGMSLLRRERPEAALPPLHRATELAPSEHRYRAALTKALLGVGALEEAADSADEGIRLFAGRPEVATYHFLAIHALTEPSPSEVAEHLLQCLSAYPAHRGCRAALATLATDAEHRPPLEERGLLPPAPRSMDRGGE